MLCLEVSAVMLRQLRAVISNDLESAHALSHAADAARNPALSRTLRVCAVLREEFAADLRAALKALGDSDACPTPGRGRRWWMDLSSIAERGGDRALLNEVIRAEAPIRESYDAVLKEPLPEELSDILHQQAESLRRVEHHLRILREVPRFL